MTLGSLFSGSGGFEWAATLCGIEPLWASEIEPFPIRVTRTQFPNIKHLGDISTINGAEIPLVDIISGGSPCQDLSVAGKRKGLLHSDLGNEETTRSGLFMEQIRIIKEMRNESIKQLRMRGSTFDIRHIQPRFMVWENVCGALTSNKGEDFKAVLEETARVKNPEITIPQPTKWNNGGGGHGRWFQHCLESVGCSILGSAPKKKKNRTCGRFWRNERTRNTI